MSTHPTHLLDALRGEPDAPALVVPGGPTFSYARLRACVEDAASRLAGSGIGRGDRVALAFPNGPEAVVLFLAAALAGTACPLNPAYTEEENAFYLEDTAARLLLVPRGGGRAAASAAARRRVPVQEVTIGAGGALEMDGGRGSVEPPSADDVALVLHTSGTTSRPKRVPLRHRHLLASVENIAGSYGLGPDDVSLCAMPLFHVHGLMASTMATLASGGTVVAPAGFSPLAFWPLARAHPPTWYSASPTFHQLILRRAEGGGRPPGTERLRFVRSCSAAMPEALLHELEAGLGAPLLEAYGMTEAAHQMASNPLPPRSRVPNSVGPATGSTEVAVMGESGDLLPAGEQGEVVVRGPNVVDGYEGNPEANAEAFRGGWFRTGDRGWIDSEGYVVLVGRIKELINRGGEKISPREVDEALESHPSVREAVAFGAPHATWGEEVSAAVVVSGPVTERELADWCRQRLAEFKVPRVIHIVDEIPRTATGKVQRRNVAAAFTEPG